MTTTVDDPLSTLRPAGFPGLPPGWSSRAQVIASSNPNVQLFMAVHEAARDVAVGAPAARALVVHGLGEHGGRYLHLPHYLKNAVSTVACLDLRGHGRSGGLRGHVERFDDYSDDLIRAIAALGPGRGGGPLHLVAHSMGGLVALRTLFHHPALPVRSLAVSAPFLGFKVKVPKLKKSAALVLTHLWGSFHMSTALDAGLVSSDPAVVEAYEADRLVHDKITPKLFTELLAAMDDVLSRDAGLQPPLLMLAPMADELVDTEVALGFFRRLKHRDKRLCQYEGFKHEPFNEVEKERVFADLVGWLREKS